jgi:NADH:ubiquinone oxidoreductase subunit
MAFTGTVFGVAAMQTPTPGSTLTGSSVTFTWSADADATAYWLDIGNVAGGNQYYQSGNLGNVFSTTASTLPTDGSTVYVTLYSQVSGQWLSNPYTYTAYNPAAAGAVMQTPSPGSTLTGSSVTFTWRAGAGTSNYWLDVGSNPGGNQYLQSGPLGNVLTTTVSTLPTDGSTVYVTLYTLIGSQWVGNSYTYKAYNPAAADAVMQTPTPGSTLTGSSVTFTWTAGAGASNYWLDVGSNPGGNQYLQSGPLGNVLTTTVSTLPTNGSTIYVTLYSLIGNVWQGNTYTFTAFNATGGLAVMQTPAPGSTLSGNAVTFTWSAGTVATAYWLDVGNAAGGNQYYQSGNLGNVLTTTVYGLPTNGSTIFVTLYSLIGGQWLSNPYTFTAFNATGGLAVMQTPAPGSTLSGNAVTFTWSAGTVATAYWLDVGNVAGGNQYYQSGNLGTGLSTTVNTLPTNGSTVYVTLYSLVSGQWLSNAYTYTAFNVASAGGVLATPTPGSTLTGSSVTFDWTAGAGASAYWLDVGGTTGGNQYYQSGNLGNVLTTTVNGLPTDGSTIYVTLHSLIGGAWSGTGYTYTALNAISGLAVMQTPTPDSTIIGRVATFTWSSDPNASGYWVDIGSVAGGNDINQSGNLGTALTTTVYSMPSDGSTIYVTLYSLVGGQWLSNAYTYVSDPILTYSARTDNCVNGSNTQSGCVSGTTTGEAGATLVFREGVSDPIPTGFTPTTINSGSCPSGSTPSSYPAYCPTPMNSTATDPDFGTYLVMATDDNTNAHNSATPYTTAWHMGSDGNWDAFSWDETLLLAKNSGGGATILNLNPAAIHAQTCATAPGCVNGSGIYPALSGAGDSTHLDHGGSWSFSRVPSEPNVLYELSNVSTQVHRLVITSSIATPGKGTLTRTLYADFVNGTGSYSGVMNSACPGNSTTYSNTWTGSFQLADDGTVSYGMTGGYDWPGASQAVVSPDCFILPTVGNSDKYGFQATTGGTTGTSEPAWNNCSTVGSTCTDGTVIWTNIGKLSGQGPGFDMLIYEPPGSADPGYTRINTRLGKIYRGAGNTAPDGLMTTNDEVVCSRVGTSPCNLPDRFTLHEVEQGEDGQYVEFSPTGGEAANPPGSWNSGTLSCQASNTSWQGAWSPTPTYSHLNIVSYAGYYWSATSASGNKNQPPPSYGWPTGNMYWTGTEAYCSSYFFDVSSTLVAPLTDWVHGSGHSAAGYLHKYYGSYYRSMLYSLPVIDGVLNPDTPMLLAPLPCDDHGTYQNSGISDLSPIFTATADVPAWPTRYDVANGACYDEICAFNSSGNGLTYRFGHTYNTGSSSYFSIQNNIGVNSPFGDLVAFGTDMMGVRGSKAAANTKCNNLRGQYQPAANGTVIYQDYVYPITNNSGANIFQATNCGSNTTGATCTEGASLPNWDSACSTTCTDGGVIWTNEGPNTCRGDIVIMDALSAHASP